MCFKKGTYIKSLLLCIIQKTILQQTVTLKFYQRDQYINEYADKLAQCNVDTNCKFQEEEIKKCENKCNKEIGLDEQCNVNGDCLNTNEVYSLNGESDCFILDKEKCISSNFCDYKLYDSGSGGGFCENKCYGLDQDTCNLSDSCYVETDEFGYNTCQLKTCGNMMDLDDKYFQGDLRNKIVLKNVFMTEIAIQIQKNEEECITPATPFCRFDF